MSAEIWSAVCRSVAVNRLSILMFGEGMFAWFFACRSFRSCDVHPDPDTVGTFSNAEHQTKHGCQIDSLSICFDPRLNDGPNCTMSPIL